MSPNRHKKAGFTLIETVMALVVFALLSVAVVMAQGIVKRNARIFLESFEDVTQTKNAQVMLEREQRLNQKEKIELPEVIPLSYQFSAINAKSSLQPFVKTCGIGLFEVKRPSGFVDRFFTVVPLPIEKKTVQAEKGETKAADTKIAGQPKQEAKKNV